MDVFQCCELLNAICYWSNTRSFTNWWGYARHYSRDSATIACVQAANRGSPVPISSKYYALWSIFFPILVHSPPIHQFFNNGTFPQQPQGGSMYPVPLLASPKYPLPQYTPGGNAGNQGILECLVVMDLMALPLQAITLVQPLQLAIRPPMSGPQFKESNAYMTGQQSEGGQVAYSTQARHGTFAGIYHPAQPVTPGAIHPHLQQSGTSVDMAALQNSHGVRDLNGQVKSDISPEQMIITTGLGSTSAGLSVTAVKDGALSVNTTLSGLLISRFDIVFVHLDTKNPDWDKVVSDHILDQVPSTLLNVACALLIITAWLDITSGLYEQAEPEKDKCHEDTGKKWPLSLLRSIALAFSTALESSIALAIRTHETQDYAETEDHVKARDVV
ncbi:hypothetical protein Tco_0754656 [Tanacetum coccineum]